MEPPWEIEHFEDLQKNGSNKKNTIGKSCKKRKQQKTPQKKLDTIVNQHTKSIIVDKLKSYFVEKKI